MHITGEWRGRKAFLCHCSLYVSIFILSMKFSCARGWKTWGPVLFVWIVSVQTPGLQRAAVTKTKLLLHLYIFFFFISFGAVKDDWDALDTWLSCSRRAENCTLFLLALILCSGLMVVLIFQVEFIRLLSGRRGSSRLVLDYWWIKDFSRCFLTQVFLSLH